MVLLGISIVYNRFKNDIIFIVKSLIEMKSGIAADSQADTI